MTTKSLKRADTFVCKKFMVAQNEEVFKITTDSLALGALAPVAKCKRVLEIGSGTGIISLMLTQQYPEMLIEAWDINAEAHKLCHSNFDKSPFAKRLQSFQYDFILKAPTREAHSFDAIVSNPPYNSNGLMPSDIHLALAKHDGQDLIPSIFEAGSRLLTDDGLICLLLPTSRQKDICTLAESNGFHLRAWTKIHAFENQPPNRHILTWQRQKTESITYDDSITVYDRDRSYHSSWKETLAAYLLDF